MLGRSSGGRPESLEKASVEGNPKLRPFSRLPSRSERALGVRGGSRRRQVAIAHELAQPLGCVAVHHHLLVVDLRVAIRLVVAQQGVDGVSQLVCGGLDDVLGARGRSRRAAGRSALASHPSASPLGSHRYLGSYLISGSWRLEVYDEGVAGVPRPLGCHSERVSGAVSLQTVRDFMKGE